MRGMKWTGVKGKTALACLLGVFAALVRLYADDGNGLVLHAGKAIFDGMAIASGLSTNTATDGANVSAAVGLSAAKRTAVVFRDGMEATRFSAALFASKGGDPWIEGLGYSTTISGIDESASNGSEGAAGLQFIPLVFGIAKDATGISGLATGALGVAMVGYSYYSGAQGLSAYGRATTQGAFDAARNQIVVGNTLLNLGISATLGGLAVGVVALFVAPDPTAVAHGILEIDRKIQDAKREDRKSALIRQRNRLQILGRDIGWTEIGGWIAGLVGLGLAGYAWHSGNQAFAAYNTATTQAAFDGARNQITISDTLFKIGIGSAAAGLAACTAALFLIPYGSVGDGQAEDLGWDQTGSSS